MDKFECIEYGEHCDDEDGYCDDCLEAMSEESDLEHHEGQLEDRNR
jgi:hypothetical protein